MSFTKFLNSALLPLIVGSALSAVTPFRALADTSAEPGLVHSLAKSVLHCAEQPYGVNRRTGNKVFGTLRSLCPYVQISGDRVVVELHNRSYTLLVKDSEMSDGGDLND